MNLHEILPVGNGTLFGQVCAKKRNDVVKVDDPLGNGRERELKLWVMKSALTPSLLEIKFAQTIKNKVGRFLGSLGSYGALKTL